MSNISDLPAHLMFCCPVCRDTYDTDERCPLSIPCGHTVCKECAARLPELFDEFTFAIVKINCPVCRAKHVVQRFADTPHGFPVNAQLLLIIDRMMEVADREKNAKPRRVEVNCRDCQKKVTVDSCVKCECFAEEEGGPEQDLLNRDTSKLLCNDCVNKSHKSHPRQTFLEVKRQFQTREYAKNIIFQLDKGKEKSIVTSAKLEQTKDRMHLLNMKYTSCKALVENIAESPHLVQNGDKYLKEFKSLEKAVDNINKETEKNCQVIEEKIKFLEKFSNQFYPGRQSSNNKFIDEQKAARYLGPFPAMSAQAVVPAPMEPRPPPADPVNPTMIIQLQRENEMLQQQLERLQQQREELRFQQRRQEIELVMEQQERRRDNELRRAHEDLFRRDARWPRLAIIERVGDQAPRAQPNIWVGPDERPARVEPQVPREEPLIEELEPVIEELEAPAEEPQEAGEEPRPPEEDIAPRGRPQRARRAPARHNPIENSNNARRRRGAGRHRRN